MDDLELLPTEEETTETAEATETAEGEQQQQAESTSDQPVELFDAEGKKLSPAVKLALEKIDPQTRKVVQRAVYKFAELNREFPGGLTEVRELRDKIGELGGLEGIEEKLEGAAELDGLAKQYMEADPAFVDDMLESSPESFAALAPIVFQKYAETQPDAYASYIGRVVYGDLQRNDIPLLMMRLADTLGENQKAVEIFNRLNDYLGGFKELASKAPAAKAAPAKPQSQQRTDNREEDLRAREWALDRRRVQTDILSSEFKKAAAGRQANSEDRAMIMELFQTRAKVDADRLFPGWEDKSKAFIRRNDKDGYLRYMTSIYRKVFPPAMAYAVSKTLRGAKPTAPAAGGQQRQAAQAAAPGFTQVSKEPNSYEIDYERTDRKMLAENRAVLKSGKKVQWR